MSDAQRRGEPPSILVVDDTPANLDLLCKMLKDRGHRVRPVPNGRLALRAVEVEPPDLVLLDINMPDMNGFEVCQSLKANPALASLPVLFISAMSETFDKVRAFSVGGADYITKPFHVEEVLARVAVHLTCRRLRTELEEQNAELRELNELRRSLTQMIIHDLKNPLSVVIANTHYLLSDHAPSEDDRAALEDTLAAAERIQRMASDALDLARAESRPLSAYKALTRVRDVLGPVVAGFSHRARDLGAAITLEGDADAAVELDRELIRRVVENLLDNALKYGVVNGEPIIVSYELGARALSVRVRDAGPGVPAEQRELVFEHYERLDRGTHIQRRGGHGMGLSFCRLAVEAHGGRIWVEDNAPKGAAFCFELPR